MTSNKLPAAFLPPSCVGTRELDRSFFRKHVPLTAARISELKSMVTIRGTLERSGDFLRVDRLRPIRDDDEILGSKLILLRHDIKLEEPATWSRELRSLVDEGKVQLKQFDLELTYDNWGMRPIFDATLPEMEEDDAETPAGFSQIGHVAHLNLRPAWEPYKYLIGQILLDKNPLVTTVINKISDVGAKSAYRTFPYEVLAGPDNLDVTVHESGCEFQFNFGKVYWNPRLSTEHARVIGQFQEGEAVCDVMAGVGPFAVPAGRKRVFVRANDLNPDAADALRQAITRNKVQQFASTSCDDGITFIRRSVRELMEHPRTVSVRPNIKVSRTASAEEKAGIRAQMERETRILHEPKIFDHFVMNLPATAVEFLEVFKGLYHGHEVDFAHRKMPLIHVYLFQERLATEAEEKAAALRRISSHLDYSLSSDDPESDIELFDVRLVAPTKKMYRASFRLPPAVAFAAAGNFVSASKIRTVWSSGRSREAR